MRYDPFARGNLPVGVRTLSLVDHARDDRALPTEVWYPTAAAHAGADLAAASQDTYEVMPGFPPVRQEAVRDAGVQPGRFPLVVFSHGYGGHRRQSTFLGTHLASHGYVVAACDHTGNTVMDVALAVMASRARQPARDVATTLREFIAARPADVITIIAQLLDGATQDLASLIAPERVGMAGHSFGGWTTLAVTGREPRIAAALVLAPAGGTTWMPAEALRDALDFAWGREVPTLFIVAERDSLLPLEGMHELLERTPSRQKRMVVLENADHMHFCDRIEETHELFRMMPPPGAFEEAARRVPPIAELAPAEHAYLAIRGLGLAHFDATLKSEEEAAGFLAGDLQATLAGYGVKVAVY